jgi:hypothetical protein
MPDDPNKRGSQDRKRVSQQLHEQAYQKRKGKEKREANTTRRTGSSSSKKSNGKQS